MKKIHIISVAIINYIRLDMYAFKPADMSPKACQQESDKCFYLFNRKLVVMASLVLMQ